MKSKNYAAKAQLALVDYKKVHRTLLPDRNAAADIRSADTLIESIRRSEHFRIPEGGKLLNSGLKGIKGREVRLPYSSITLEYDDIEAVDQGSGVTSSKRLIIANEYLIDKLMSEQNIHESTIDILKEFKVRSNYVIYIMAMYYLDHYKVWVPSSVFGIMSSNWEATPAEKAAESLEDGEHLIPFHTFVFFPYRFEGCISLDMKETGRPKETIISEIVNDITEETYPLLEFLEALTCSNIRMESLPGFMSDKMNTTRLRNGALPKYETKILVLTTGDKTVTRTGEGGSHASPRQHLRRGHIRRLPKGNIWVNSCVVGKDGFIDKTYEVRP